MSAFSITVTFVGQFVLRKMYVCCKWLSQSDLGTVKWNSVMAKGARNTVAFESRQNEQPPLINAIGNIPRMIPKTGKEYLSHGASWYMYLVVSLE